MTVGTLLGVADATAGRGTRRERWSPRQLESLGRGARRSYSLAFAASASRTIDVPINVATGARQGPCVVAVAGVHGNELEGPAALFDAWELLDSAEFAGTLVTVPIANPTAFEASQRTSPLDGVDMNRAFPGRADGSPTERLAHRLFEEVVLGANFVISMHSWYGGTNVVPYVEVPATGPTADASRAAGRAFGLEYVEPLEWDRGLLGAAAGRAGIPAIEPEIGGLGISSPEGRALYRSGLRNLLAHLGLLGGARIVGAAPRLVTRTEIRAPVQGFLRPLVEIRAVVKHGTAIAHVCDLNGTAVAEITAPCSGLLAGLRLSAAVAPGDLVGMIFVEGDLA